MYDLNCRIYRNKLTDKGNEWHKRTKGIRVPKQKRMFLKSVGAFLAGRETDI